jgi:ATP-dependent Clp protease protease subunit
MAKLRIYNQIVNEEDKVFLQDWYGTDGICYKDIPEFLDSMDDGDNEIDIKLHCPGGDCIEGWAIYDALRNSGKTISATIEGECSSMATIILLAAPKERRFGFENARMCIHNPAVAWLDLWSDERLTADEIKNLKAKLTAQEISLIEEQNKILNLYVERTGADREELQSLMNEDKYVDMARATELGFIASTLAPNTDNKKKHKSSKSSKMAKEQIKIENRIVKKLLSMAGIAKIEDVQILDQKITAADGTEFTVEREDGDPQVGDKAYPNGTYVLEDGTTIVVADEVIESITPADNGEGEGGDGDGNGEGDGSNDLKAQVDNLTQQVADLTEQVNTLTSEKEALATDKANLESKVTDLEAKLAALEPEAKTDEEKAILDVVNKAGGKAWLDGLKDMSSTFTASNRKFVAHGDNNGGQQGETRAQRMLREQRERQEAKRKARK